MVSGLKPILCLFMIMAGLVSNGYGAIDNKKVIWEKQFGGSKDDYVQSIIATPDGGILAGCVTYSNDKDISYSHDTGSDDYYHGDYWLIKLDNQGKMEWQKTYGGSNQEYITSIILYKDSGYIVVGSSYSGDGDITRHLGSADFWILRLDRNGSIIWQKTYGGYQEDEPYAVAITPDSGIVLAGYTKSDSGDVKYHYISADIWIIKLNKIGEMLWQKTYGTSTYEYAEKILVTQDSGFIVCANGSSQYDSVVKNVHWGGDGWLIRLDKNGNKLWGYAYGGAGEDVFTDVKITKDKGYIAVGYTLSNDGDLKNNLGYTDAFIVKVDRYGKKEWVKSYGSTHSDYAISVELDDDSGYIVSCLVYSKDSDFATFGNHYICLLNLNNQGNIISKKGVGQGSISNCSVSLGNGIYVFGGSIRDSTDTTNFPANKNVYIAYLGDSTTAVQESKTFSNFIFYPNPTTSTITLEVNNLPQTNTSITISDILGKQLIQLNQTPNSEGRLIKEIDVSALPDGMYFILVQNEKVRVVSKLVVE
ncbi:MAG: T9SS type A sorting domain-containing protein [Bacteroidetes bacterium]|nr:T9SS type A sorting domain-containing protein [Bacteroidota bacterium]